MIFSTFTVLCNHHLYLVLKHCFHCQRKSHPLCYLSCPPSSQPLATTNLLSASADSPILDISYIGIHIIRSGDQLPLSIIFSRFIHTGSTYHCHVTFYGWTIFHCKGFSSGLAVKNPPASADVGLVPGSGRSPGEANSNPLQYSCLGNPMDRGAWGLWSVGSQRVRHNWETD